MKTIYKIILILVIVITFLSCDDWLYLKPEDGIIRDEFWNSKEDVELAMIGCYASLLGNTGGEKTYDIPTLLFVDGEIRADMLVIGKVNNDYLKFLYGDIEPDNGLCRWDAFYRIINLCNNLLYYAPIVKTKDNSFTDKKLNEYKAEALALRSLMYFYLTRLYDEVPLKLDATLSDNNNYAIPKSTRAEVFKQIKQDLKIAEKYIPISFGDNNSDKGRITKQTVNAIQADVYLWCNQYDSALLECDSIIKSGKYGLVEGSEQGFIQLFVTGNSPESLFELQFHQNKLNPYYSMFVKNYYLRGNPDVIEDVFLSDPEASPDSADIRGDGYSYRTALSYTIWKYIGVSKRIARTENESYAHFIIYRYADILLMKAEALAQLGYGKEALAIVNNTIRKRANASKTTAYDGADDDIDAISNFILKERQRELAFEGKRWFDVLRNAKRDNYRKKDIIINALVKGAPADKSETIKAKAQDTLYHYLPIPYNELNTNKLLKQNPFYEH